MTTAKKYSTLMKKLGQRQSADSIKKLVDKAVLDGVVTRAEGAKIVRIYAPTAKQSRETSAKIKARASAKAPQLDRLIASGIHCQLAGLPKIDR
jgi:hypothetical protein